MGNTYGEWLKTQREAAGLTQQELANMTVMTRSHIAHIEAGRRVSSKEDARRLDNALSTGDTLSSFLPDSDAAVADYFEATRQLEQQATVIREFAYAFVPGILQTEGYARAVLGASHPPTDEQECDRLVVTRLERSNILDTFATPVAWVLLDEAVLHRAVGGPKGVAEQIQHMVGLVGAGRVRIHVMPYRMGAYPLLQSMLTPMWFENQPPVAYTEGLQVGRFHDSPSMVTRLQSIYDLALSDAQSLTESLALLRATAEAYERHD
ncbi:Scr1 family TA system antitoxin-like transcriptional regulator [Streptomyces albidoflavus]